MLLLSASKEYSYFFTQHHKKYHCLTLQNFQLANIIWDEGGESDDHIVPFPEASEDVRNKKEVNQESAVCKLSKLKQPEAKTDFHEKLGSSSNLDNSGGLPDSGYGETSWHDLSLSSATKIEQGSLGTELSTHRGELSKLSTSRGGKIANCWNY